MKHYAWYALLLCTMVQAQGTDPKEEAAPVAVETADNAQEAAPEAVAAVDAAPEAVEATSGDAVEADATGSEDTAQAAPKKSKKKGKGRKGRKGKRMGAKARRRHKGKKTHVVPTTGSSLETIKNRVSQGSMTTELTTELSPAVEGNGCTTTNTCATTACPAA